jgi:TatD DNase family protein
VSGVDAHTHLDLPAFDLDRQHVVERARQAGVSGFVISAADPADWDRVERVGRELGAAWTLGVHPWWGTDLDDPSHDALLDALSRRETPHGIGETGLDFARAKEPAARDRQRASTRAHLALARARRVPVVLHVVRAYPQITALLKADGVPEAGAMIHAWSGPPDTLDTLTDLGVCVSIGAGVATSWRTAEVAARVPDHLLMLETDAPDQPWTPGARGEPADLVRVAERVAALRGSTTSQVLELSARNARRLFPTL